MAIEGFITAATAGVALGGSVLALAWKGDEAISEDARRAFGERLLSARMPGPGADWPGAVAAGFDRVFGPDAFSLRFVARAVLLSLIAVAAAFAVYVAITPGFAASLRENPYQRGAVASQILHTAIFANAVADWLCLAWCRETLARMSGPGAGAAAMARALLADIAMKAVIFLAAMAVIYMSQAGRGAFGGSTLNALAAVPATLLDGLAFRNLSGVYLYSCLLSSFWLWSFAAASAAFGAARGLPALARALRWALPLRERPVRSLGLVAAGVAIAGSWAAALLA